MDKIQAWVSDREWRANMFFADSGKNHEFSVRVTGMGSSEEKAKHNLCDALMTLREKIGRVVQEENIK